MKTASPGLVAIFVLSGCSVMQETYDERALNECRELPTFDERLACERAATDREIQRRADEEGDS